MKRSSIYKILSVPAYGLMYIFTALMVFSGLPFIYLGMKVIVKNMMKFWARGIFFILGKKLTVKGRENVVNDLHYVLLANHSSLFDIVAIVSVVPDLSWFGHERLLRIPVFRRVLILTDYIPMKKANIKNTREMVKSLVEKSCNHNIAIFPEGTRSLDGKINDFYRGFILLLRSSDIDALPLTLNGFYDLKPKNRFWIDFGAELEVVIHKPLKREFLVSRSDSEIAAIVRSAIESAAGSKINNRLTEQNILKSEFIKA